MKTQGTPSVPSFGRNYHNSPPPPAALQKPVDSKLFKARKPQISSIPGISPREKNRYRVMLGEEILGDRLTIDEALILARGGGR